MVPFGNVGNLKRLEIDSGERSRWFAAEFFTLVNPPRGVAARFRWSVHVVSGGMKGRCMTGEELERLALEVRARAGLGLDEIERAPQIVLRVLGPASLAISESMRCAGRLTKVDGRYVIVVRKDVPDLNFTCAHELAHWALLEVAGLRLRRAEEERAANLLGAAILAPKLTVLRAYEYWPERVSRLAREFGLSKTGMVLRMAEARNDERAVVTRTGNVLLRSQGGFPWADVPLLQVARGTRWRGLAKTSLRGGIDEGRVALRAK